MRSSPWQGDVFAGYLLFMVGVPSFTWIADAPQLIFNPPVISIANLLEARPPPRVLLRAQRRLASRAHPASVGAGIWTRVVSVLTGVLLLVGFNLSYSFGKLDHDVLLALTPLAMSISGWGNAYSLLPDWPAFKPDTQCRSHGDSARSSLGAR